jgi:hypothetical protein
MGANSGAGTAYQCFSSFKAGDKSNEKGPGCTYDRWNMFVVICDIDIPLRLTEL